jgi:hypothetical protein
MYYRAFIKLLDQDGEYDDCYTTNFMEFENAVEAAKSFFLEACSKSYNNEDYDYYGKKVAPSKVGMRIEDEDGNYWITIGREMFDALKQFCFNTEREISADEIPDFVIIDDDDN